MLIISTTEGNNVLVNMKSICSPSSHIIYQGIMCTYLLRHAIFNEQSDLDGKDIILYDLVWLVMRYKYQKDNENEKT